MLLPALRLVEHQMDVLERLADAAFRREIAADHSRPLVSMTCEARRAARDVEKRRGIEAEALGKHQPLGERQAVETENEIDRKLGAAAVADLADVKAPREQRVEHGAASAAIRRIAADQADAVALADLFAGARHRRLEKAQSSPTRAPSAAMRSGSQVEVTSTILPGRPAGSSVALDHSSTCSVLNTATTIAALLRDIGERTGPHAELRQARVFRRIDVEADHRKSRRDQAAG